MSRDQLEFLISQYLDGMLPSEERAALEREIASNPAARGLLDEHLKLNNLIKGESGRTPAVQWDRLTQQIADAAAGQAAGEGAKAGDLPDDIEFAVMQYADGELPEEERAAVENRLATDPAARQILNQHRALGTALKHAWTIPHVDHERFGKHLREAVVDEVVPSSYSISAWVRYGAAVAVAACVVIAAVLVIEFGTDRHRDGNTNGMAKVEPTPVEHKPVLIVKVMPEEPSATPVVRIGPSDDGMALPGDAVVAAANKSQLAVFADTVPVSSDNGLFAQ